MNQLNHLLKPLGLILRSFVVDYRDAEGGEYNAEINILGDADDGLIMAACNDLYGVNVYAVTELLNGYTEAELKGMDSREAFKNIRIVYMQRKP